MLWRTSRIADWNPWREMDVLHNEMHRLLSGISTTGGHSFGEFPAMNVWTGDEAAVLTAEIPGIDPDDLEVTINKDTVTIRGVRSPNKPEDGEEYIRNERGSGSFVRSFSLPFPLEEKKTRAEYRNGILKLTLPRAEEDKPRRIKVNAAEKNRMVTES